MKTLTLFFSAFFIVPVWSQMKTNIGAEANGLGGTSLTNKDAFSSYNNPGVLAIIQKNTIGFSYDNRFLLKELSLQSLSGAFKLKRNGVLGGHMQHFGFGLFRQVIAGVSYGIKLAPNFSLGTTINFHRLQLGDNYGAKNSFSMGLGMYYEVTGDLAFGMRVTNITRTKLTDFQDERLPTAITLGFKYTFSKKVFWNLEAEKNIVHPLNIKTGFGFQPHELLALRVGVNTYPFQSTFGIGLSLPKFRFDIAAGWHTQLGISPSAGLVFEFNE